LLVTATSVPEEQALPNPTAKAPAILYEHPLLGEGIAQCLRAEAGVEANLACAHDIVAVKAALAVDPDIVIFERSPLLSAVELAELAPHAELVDITDAVPCGRVVTRATIGVEPILQAIRRTLPRSPGH
jgi:hypothetical protein